MRSLRHFKFAGRRAALCVLVALLVVSGGAQQVGQNAVAPANGTTTFQANTQLVVETVSVKDKSGKAVEGLTAKDFTVTEDGAPQNIRFFEFQKLDEPAVKPEPAAPSTGVVALAKLPKAQLATEAPGNTKYRDRRLLALYFDMSAMPIADQLRS